MILSNNFFFYCRMARGRKSKSRSRKARKTIRRVRGKRCWSGGANQLVFPAPVENSTYESSFSSPSKMMLEQGNEYQSIHSGQHGGAAAANLAPAPPGFTGVLEDGLRGQAWVSPLDQSVQAIQGMSDQAGGARGKGRKGAKRGSKRAKSDSKRAKSAKRAKRGSKRAKSSKRVKRGSKRAKRGSKRAKSAKRGSKRAKSAKRTRRGRRAMRGGAAASLANAQDFGAPGMLLSPAQQAAALGGMNPEWKLAMDPASFAPNLSK